MNQLTYAPQSVLPFIMIENEIKQSIAQAHFDAYVAAIKDGKTPGQALQVADIAATTQRHTLTEMTRVDQQASSIRHYAKKRITLS